MSPSHHQLSRSCANIVHMRRQARGAPARAGGAYLDQQRYEEEDEALLMQEGHDVENGEFVGR